LEIQEQLCEISGSHGGDYEDKTSLHYGAAESHKISRFIYLMIEAVRTSETSVYFYEATRRYMAQGSNHLFQEHESRVFPPLDSSSAGFKPCAA
jgi:hypothetical protein